MTSEPGEQPLFSVMSGQPSAEELAALTAIVAAKLAASQRAAAPVIRGGQPSPLSLAGPRGADPCSAAPRPRRLAPLQPALLDGPGAGAAQADRPARWLADEAATAVTTQRPGLTRPRLSRPATETTGD